LGTQLSGYHSRQLIETARQSAATRVNSELTLLFWRIGRRIHKEVLVGERAEYGDKIIARRSIQLVRGYGRSFTEKNLRRMMQFATVFPDEQIVVTMSRQLSWSHFVALLPLKEPLQRNYYAQMCFAERWSVRTLRGRIDSIAISPLVMYILMNIKIYARLRIQGHCRSPAAQDIAGAAGRLAHGRRYRR